MAGRPKRISLNIVANGQRVVVEAARSATLRSAVETALKESGNVGRPLEDWEARDVDGRVLDKSRLLREFSAGATVFANLKAGVGGATSAA